MCANFLPLARKEATSLLSCGLVFKGVPGKSVKSVPGCVTSTAASRANFHTSGFANADGRLAFEQELSPFIEKYSKYSPSPLSVQNFIDFGSKATTEKSSYLFLKKEIAVRLSNIIKEILYLPPKLLQMPSVELVRSWYLLSLKEVLAFNEMDDNDPKTVRKFTEAVRTIRNRHNTVVQTMAEGILELKSKQLIDSASDSSIQYFLDRFYMMRISIRMLLLQHIFISEQESGSSMRGEQTNPRFVGLIDPQCAVSEVVQDAYHDARFLCEQYYNNAPDLELIEVDNGSNQDDGPGKSLTLPYIPSHLHHIAFELFKNAMRATIEHRIISKKGESFPPIVTTIAKGDTELSIKISDKGGGFPHQEASTLFKYLYTTASLPMFASNNPDLTPLAGYGYGLPLSRLYARYFNGDLVLCSQEGLGTDALIYLHAYSSSSFEHLPVFNAATRRQYLTPSLSSDWTAPPSHHGNNGNSSNTTTS